MQQSGPKLRYLKDLWDGTVASSLDEPERLRCRSNQRGADLRITNFGGGNTSSKVKQQDPVGAREVDVPWVKGSGGDLGSIKRTRFATLCPDKLHGLEKIYQGVEFKDEMVGYYPLCSFGLNAVAPSIDKALHGFLPLNHVDHLHPDWATALAAAANGREQLQEFTRRFNHNLIWLPWQRPGFKIGHNPQASTDELRNKPANFCAQRTLTGEPIDPLDCARPSCFLQ